MGKWLREPLLHFLVLGALIFFAYGRMAADRPGTDEIFISKGQQENLLNTFARTWQRPPTPEEFQGLLKDYIRQEIAYRESREMGLEQDDIVIRRRLRQKLELLAEDVASMVPPSDEQLQEYLDENPDDFLVEPRLTLRHVYFSRDRRGEEAEQDALTLLQRISADGPEGDFEAFGDPLPLPPTVRNLSEGEVARLFGTVFTDGLQGIEPGRWSGPVESGFGLHLVFIEDRVAGRAPALDEVRDAVQREWLSQRRREAVDGLYERLARNYAIEIESLLDEAPATAEGR
ncbi:MAG: peptidyl-prolyl cis-trans isomerase [Xanthomonadales bacterium]|nr:peptidyl-prolyl cis-trans isomerase [Xanthomonadales bacterium]